jgi:HSP20 family protein
MSLTTLRRRTPLFEGGFPVWFDTNELFEDFFNNGKNLPAMNIKEDEKHFEIELAVPGFSKNEIEVSMEDGKLHVFAEKENKKMDEKKEGYLRKEFSYNSFERLISLPPFVKKDEEVKAIYKNGILKLVLPKTNEEITNMKKRIEIA